VVLGTETPYRECELVVYSTLLAGPVIRNPSSTRELSSDELAKIPKEAYVALPFLQTPAGHASVGIESNRQAEENEFSFGTPNRKVYRV
jgi:hypothetical protein